MRKAIFKLRGLLYQECSPVVAVAIIVAGTVVIAAIIIITIKNHRDACVPPFSV